MKKPRGCCIFLSLFVAAGFAHGFDCLNTGLNFGHLFQVVVAFDVGYALKPQAPTGFAVEELIRTDKGADVLLRQGLGGNQGIFFGG